MDSSFGPPFAWPGGPRRWGSADPNMRVSDAERTEMSDILSKHYADGRLDDSEFKIRLDKAMSAKTRADLSGLLGDLPTAHPEATRPRHAFSRRIWWAFSAVAIVVLALSLMSALIPTHFPWTLAIIVFAVIWFRRGHLHHHHRYQNDPRY
jgi:hypothetical protein